MAQRDGSAPVLNLRNGHVVSDLHLFAHWSAAHRYAGRMTAAAANSDFFVLNGDVFDLRWTVLSSVDETVGAAAEWLRRFAAAHPRCQVFYVMGNHDNSADFAALLDGLCGTLPNFHWHSSHVQLHNALFLHGDLAFDRAAAGPFRRQLRETVRTFPKAARHCYNVLHSMRVQRWHAPVFPRKRCAKRVLESLEAAGLPAGVTDVYFGHTHLRFSDYAHGGLTFHNTGCAIRGLRGGIVPVELKHRG